MRLRAFGLVAALLAGRRHAQFPEMRACASEGSQTYERVSELLGEAVPLTQIESHHAVALVPSSASFDTGEALVSAIAYAALPRTTHGPYTTAMTKVVMLAHGEVSGLQLADCGLTDHAAADWLRDKAEHLTNGIPIQAGHCDAAPFSTQVPFLNLAFEGKLEGNVLPLVLGDQTATTAQQTANLLRTLVDPSLPGPYKDERVLFVFAADLSRDLEKKWAIPRDQETVQNLVTTSFGDLATYFDDLEKVQLPGEHRRPYDFAVVLAASKLAGDLQLRGSSLRVSNSGDFIGATDRNENDKVRGYAAALFYRDDRPEGQRMSSAAKNPELPPTTTTTTTVAPTVQPPPTVIPADQLSMTPGPMLWQAKLRRR